jgi:epoxyqueuosine reductase QueG
MNLKDKIRKVVLEDEKLDFFGVAPVERFKYAPEGHRPEDILPEAKSVISIGARILEGVSINALRVQYKGFPRHLFYSYLWYGYGLLNWIILDRTAYIVANMLEKEGHIALPIASSGSEWSSKEGERRHFGQFSNRHAAVAAGLAEFGLNRLALNPSTGPRARWVSVITTAELDSDPLYNGPKLCRADICARICEEKFGVRKPLCHHVCPVNAFSTDKMDKVVIGDKIYYYPDIDMVKCAWVGASGAGLLRKDVKVPKHIKTFKDIRKEVAYHSDPVVRYELTFAHRAHYCGRCITLCPSPTFTRPSCC